MYRSILLVLCVYSLIGLTFAIASTTNPALNSFNPKPVGLPSQNLPVSNDQDIQRVDQFQNQNFDRPYDKDTLHARKCYTRYGKAGCLNFPSRPNRPCNTDFVYHGVHGLFECHARSRRI